MNHHKCTTSVLLALTLLTGLLAIITSSVYATSWSNDTQLTANPDSDYSPTVTQGADGKIWVLWHRVQAMGADIFYRTYNATWSSETALITGLGNDINPAVLQSRDGKFWVFWTSDAGETTGNYRIFYKTSSDSGKSWSANTQLTYTEKYLYVDNLTENITGNWTKTGTSPYIEAIDYPTNCINQTTQSNMGSIGEFSFADVTSYSGERVYIEIYAKQPASGIDPPDSIEIWLYNQGLSEYSLAGTLTPGITWSWKSTIDVSSTLNTTSKINAAKAYLVKKTLGAAQNIEIDAMRIKIELGAARLPSVMQAADGKIWVVWHSSRAGNLDLFYKLYDGKFWSYDIRLTNNTASDWQSSIMQSSDGTIWVFWSSFRTGNYGIFYKTSSDNGLNWSDDMQLTDAKAWDETPYAMQSRDGKIWIVWARGSGTQDYNIYYKTYDGSLWSSDIALVQDNSEDILPSIFQAENKTIWVAWSSNRVDDFDIFYRLTIPDMHDVGIASITTSPNFLYRGFETPVQISINVWNYGQGQETFSVRVYQNTTEIGTQIVTLASNTKRTLTYSWETLGLPYGYYKITAETSIVPGESDIADNSIVDGTVTLTIPGDINGDHIVDILDVGAINAYWYDPPVIGTLGYHPNADINKDGRIDLFDTVLIYVNWKKSW